METLKRELQSVINSMAGSEYSLRYRTDGIILTYALPSARKPGDVAIVTLGPGQLISDSMAARMTITGMRFDHDIRSLGIIRYSPDIIAQCRTMLLDICTCDRFREPPGGESIDWGVAFCCEREEGVPDVIFDTGNSETDGLIRFFGINPTVVSGSINRILTRISNTNSLEE